ncbi:hypothetical protein [Burkholderia vietnamiensis]|uniref:hypothetical protein n=1 Tax=Burkholderia vietnamiensis TaxID=60552 RepID=UPI000AFF7B38|nr:hypothetical protein [Burkholderia vietnamiensis]
MSDLNAAPSSTEPAADVAPMSPAELAALPDWVKNGQPPAPEAGTAAVGETAAAPAAAVPSDISATTFVAAAASGVTPAAGETGNVSAATAAPTTSTQPTSDASEQADASATGSSAVADAPAIVQEGTVSADSINLGAHLSRLDGILAELERKLALGIHTFAHEITAARDHLAKLL